MRDLDAACSVGPPPIPRSQARNGRKPADPSASVGGLAPWQIDRAKKDLSSWTPEGLAAAITAVAQADAEVKGGGRDPVFAVERAVLTIAGAHGSGR